MPSAFLYPPFVVDGLMPKKGRRTVALKSGWRRSQGPQSALPKVARKLTRKMDRNLKRPPNFK